MHTAQTHPMAVPAIIIIIINIIINSCFTVCLYSFVWYRVTANNCFHSIIILYVTPVTDSFANSRCFRLF